MSTLSQVCDPKTDAMMRSWKPSRGELVFLLICAAAWVALTCWLAPEAGGPDVYMFRDPACNFVAGLGFRSASVDHAHSFQPMLYSHYTPLYLWLFIPAAKLLGFTGLADTVFQGFWTILIDITTVVVGLRFLEKRWLRWLFLGLVAILLPCSVLRPNDRPEPLSFCLLVALAILLRQKPNLKVSLFVGILGAAAFLSEPFAGVVAVGLIAGWLLAALMQRTSSAKHLLGMGTACMLAYAIPISVVAVSYYEIDHESLHRFMYQAVNTGVSRDLTYTTGEGPNWSQKNVDQSSRLGKIESGLRLRKTMGPLAVYETCLESLMILAWLAILITSKGGVQRVALAGAGLICFIFPLVVFPMQGGYLTLGCALFPVLLALNWGSSRRALRFPVTIPALIAILIVAEFPSQLASLVQRAEARVSYRYAEEQAQLFRQYLVQHPLEAPVVLVPPSHYFLYKNVVNNLFNPQFLSYKYQNPAEIGAVVNCYAGTKDFQPGTLQLPAFVAGERWQAISTSRYVVPVTLFHRKAMSRNWSMDCDLYVRAPMQETHSGSESSHLISNGN